MVLIVLVMVMALSLPRNPQNHLLHRKILPDAQAPLPAPAARDVEAKLLRHFLVILIVHKSAHQLVVALFPGVHIILVDEKEVVEVEALLLVARYHQETAVGFFDLAEPVARVDEAEAQALVSQVLALQGFEGIVVQHMLQLKAEAVLDEALLDVEDHVEAALQVVGNALELARNHHVEGRDEVLLMDPVNDPGHMFEVFLVIGVGGLLRVADLRHEDVMVHFGYLCKRPCRTWFSISRLVSP